MLGSHQVIFGRGTATAADGNGTVAHSQATQVQDYFITVHIRHNDVGDDHVVGLVLVQSLGFATILGSLDVVALDFKSLFHHEVELFVVIDNQDSRH